jgi:hypothetical protein
MQRFQGADAETFVGPKQVADAEDDRRRIQGRDGRRDSWLVILAKSMVHGLSSLPN